MMTRRNSAKPEILVQPCNLFTIPIISLRYEEKKQIEMQSAKDLQKFKLSLPKVGKNILSNRAGKAVSKVWPGRGKWKKVNQVNPSLFPPLLTQGLEAESSLGTI